MTQQVQWGGLQMPQYNNFMSTMPQYEYLMPQTTYFQQTQPMYAQQQQPQTSMATSTKKSKHHKKGKQA